MKNRVTLKQIIANYSHKLSFLEYFVILWLIFFAGLFYYKNSRHLETIYIDLIYPTEEWMTSPNPPEYWKTSSIKTGDRIRSFSGQEFATVTNVEKSFSSGDRQYIFITIQAQALYNKTSKNYQIGNNLLLIGSPLQIYLDKTSFNGTIFDVYQNPDQQFANYVKATATITVNYVNLDPEHVASLANFYQHDSNGKQTVKLVAIKDIASNMIVTTSSGEVLLKKNPLYRDLTLTLELSDVLCANTDCFFNKVTPLKIGAQIWFASGTTLLHPNENATFDPHQGIITSLTINRHDN
jgi:hypothetical protein